LYAGELLGNGTQSYIKAYSTKQKKIGSKTAEMAASRLISNDKICKRITELLDKDGFNDKNVDVQHLFLISQFQDWKTKLGAIKEYNSLKQRITKNVKVDKDVTVKKFIVPAKTKGDE
jgi:hypothetical protein